MTGLLSFLWHKTGFNHNKRQSFINDRKMTAGTKLDLEEDMIHRVSHLVSLFSFAFLAACSTSGALLTKEKSTISNLNNNDPISQFSASGVERSIVPVVGDIYRFFDNNHSSLFLVSDEGVLFIDPLNVAAAEWVNSEINRIFDKKITHVLYSHAHQDHASGAAMFGDVEIISHVNTFDVIKQPSDHELSRGYINYDNNSDGTIELSEVDPELEPLFTTIDLDGDGRLTGYETETYVYKDVVPPTQTFDSPLHIVEYGDHTIEMHFVGGNHASDMSYIVFRDESLIFYVDVISLRAILHGPLAWYSKEDSDNTYAVALGIDADIAVPSHGPIGTQDDVRDLQQYMLDLRERVMMKIDAGESLETIQATLDMQDYAHFDYFEERLPLNIQGMYRVLMEERAAVN